MGEKNDHDILNFFDDLVEKNTENTGKLHQVYLDDKYKDSLFANLFSQVEFLKNEINEKNYLIRNLLNRMKDNNCIIFPNSVSMSKVAETHVETSSTWNDDPSKEKTLIDFRDESNELIHQ